MKRRTRAALTVKTLRILAGALTLVVAMMPMPASAQLSRVGEEIIRSYPLSNTNPTVFADVAWDSVNDVYLQVVGKASGRVYGVFVDRSGIALAPVFEIDSSGAAPRVTYGGGQFLVTWHNTLSFVWHVWGRRVSYTTPGFVASGTQRISDVAEGGSHHLTGPAIAYSETSSRFLVAWRTVQKGIRGRLVAPNGDPQGAVLQLQDAGGSLDLETAWNATTNDFGLLYSSSYAEGEFIALRRVNAITGAVSDATSFGFVGFGFSSVVGIAVNAVNEYIVVWGKSTSTKSGRLDANGNLLTPSDGIHAWSEPAADYVSYNPTTQTLLVVGRGHLGRIVGIELNSQGVPLSFFGPVSDEPYLTGGDGNQLPQPARIAARANTNQWAIVNGLFRTAVATQIVESASSGTAGVGAAPTISVPDVTRANQQAVPVTITGVPGAAVRYLVGYRAGTGTLDGNGTLFTHVDLTMAADEPRFVSMAAMTGAGGASELGFDTSRKDTIAPFGGPSFGLPPIDATNQAAALLSISSQANLTCDYRVSDGSRTLTGVAALNNSGYFQTTLDLTSFANGEITISGECADWAGNVGPTGTATTTKNVAPAPPPVEPTPPSPSPSACATPDPFVALGGGTCCSNGDWLPPGMTCPTSTPSAPPPPPPSPSPSACATPDPFVALGGGTCCSNGDWLPPGMTCPTGTTSAPPPPPPSASACATPDPFVALGGGTCCSNGDWLPPGMTCQAGTTAAPPSTTTGCTGPDPFVGIPGLTGECINGGWVPRIGR